MTGDVLKHSHESGYQKLTQRPVMLFSRDTLTDSAQDSGEPGYGALPAVGPPRPFFSPPFFVFGFLLHICMCCWVSCIRCAVFVF